MFCGPGFLQAFIRTTIKLAQIAVLFELREVLRLVHHGLQHDHSNAEVVGRVVPPPSEPHPRKRSGIRPSSFAQMLRYTTHSPFVIRIRSFEIHLSHSDSSRNWFSGFQSPFENPCAVTGPLGDFCNGLLLPFLSCFRTQPLAACHNSQTVGCEAENPYSSGDDELLLHGQSCSRNHPLNFKPGNSCVQTIITEARVPRNSRTWWSRLASSTVAPASWIAVALYRFRGEQGSELVLEAAGASREKRRRGALLFTRIWRLVARCFVPEGHPENSPTFSTLGSNVN